MKKLLQGLADTIQGDVKTDFFSRKAYSIDASIYQIEPLGVVCPKNNQDIKEIVAFSNKNKIPLIPRGAGTGTTGGCIGSGLVIDLSKYLNRILEINFQKHYAVCEPGVVQDQLNANLAESGYRLGPDTSTGNRATIGGMTGNNSSGTHSMRYGKMVDSVHEAEVIIANGNRVLFSLHKSSPSSSNHEKDISYIYDKIDEICKALKDEIQERYPKIQRRVSGYNLDEFITSKPINLAKLITGSEGTLGITTAIKVAICRKPAYTGMCLFYFDDLITALKSVESILEFKPFSVELIDHHIIENACNTPSMYKAARWLTEVPAAMLAIEFTGESPSQLVEKLDDFESKIHLYKSRRKSIRLINAIEISQVRKLRKAGLGLLMARRSNAKAIAFLEDIAVPVSSLCHFMSEFRSYIRSVGKKAGFYGHAGVGCIHVRPMLDLNRESEVDTMVKMMEDVSDMVLNYGGALSGEHGDGLIRSWLNEKMFGPKLYNAFKEIKTIFDPENLMNPGKIVDAQGPRENLRIGPKDLSSGKGSVFTFNNEGGLGFALSMCNGNGECRKTNSGVMCPSFHVTNDERDTTRARAQSLVTMISGKAYHFEHHQKELLEILDLCIECKGCKRECPAHVDMAKMKAEFLYHYYKKHRRPIRDRIFGNVDKMNRLGTIFSPFSNRILDSGINKWIMNSIGIDCRRGLIPFAEERFSTWFRNRKIESRGPYTDKILLFIDTFTEYNYPEIGKAAVKILERLNCDLVVPKVSCCGRPLISKGFLNQAKEKAIQLLRELAEYVENGYRIVGLEPSCILTLKDEYPDLIKDKIADKIAAYSSTIDVYLHDLITRGEFGLEFTPKPEQVKIHGHCHQKAIEGMEPSIKVLEAISGVSVKEINSGCCGMAGSFGYEREHYDFSLRIGETRLFPAVRTMDKDTLLVANGVSCRQQIKQGTNRTALHLASVLADKLA